MTKVLVLYYSMYGHIEVMAQAVAEGVRKVEGVDVMSSGFRKPFPKTKRGR